MCSLYRSLSAGQGDIRQPIVRRMLLQMTRILRMTPPILSLTSESGQVEGQIERVDYAVLQALDKRRVSPSPVAVDREKCRV